MSWDPYAALGVSRSASADEIRSAYRKLAKELHPDVRPNDAQAEERFKRVTAAFNLLSDPAQRGKFDRGEIDADGNEKQGFRTRSYRPQSGPAQDEAAFDLGDIFADLFGSGAGGQRGFAKMRGRDLRYALDIDFIEAAIGGRKRIQLDEGRALDVAQVNSIVHLVSSSVPELTPDHVTVVDQAGRLLTGKNDAGSLRGLNAGQLDYLREVESYYAKRVESIVSPIVGDGNVRAEVRADLDFSEIESTSESYKPNPAAEQQAVRSRQSVLDINGAGNQAAGIPGALSNQPPGPATAPLTAQAGGATAATAQTANGSRREENTINFEIDRTIRHTKESMGRIKRLSVAVVVNYRQQAGQSAKPLAPDEMQQVTNLVREAMGFSQERGDTVNVVNAAFSETKVEPADIPLWKDPSNVAFAKESLKNLLVIGLAFYLVFGVLRPLLKDWLKPKPAEIGKETEDILAAFDAKLAQKELTGYDAHLASVRDFAKQNPKAAADIIKEWISKE